MGSLKNIVSFLKKHDFRAVTLACMITIGIVVTGFKVSELIALISETPEHQEPVQNVTPGNTDKQPELSQGTSAIFQDNALKTAVANALRIDASLLTLEMLEGVTSLQILSSPNITSWQDICLMPNLEELTIINCGLVSVQPFSGLSKLKVLNLSENAILDISELLILEELEKLNISDNPIETLPNLSPMQNLAVLDLDNTAITDLAFLKDSSVSELHISYTNLPSFEPLVDCEKLEVLYMYGYHFMDLTPLHQLPHFHSIYLSQGFDRSQVDFLVGRFMMADNYTRIYLVLKNRGIDVYG